MIKTSILDIIFFFLGSTTCFTKIYSSIAGKGDASGVYVPCDVFLAIHQKKTAKLNGKSINDTLRYFEYGWFTSSP